MKKKEKLIFLKWYLSMLLYLIIIIGNYDVFLLHSKETINKTSIIPTYIIIGTPSFFQMIPTILEFLKCYNNYLIILKIIMFVWYILQ